MARGTGRKSLESAMRLLTGEPIHAFYRDLLSSAFPDDYGSEEAEVRLDIGEGAPILGHIDGYIASLRATVEIKSVGVHTYAMVKDQGRPLPAHLAQGNLYTGCFDGAEQTLFVYHNRDSGEYTMFLVPFIPDLFHETSAKFLAARKRNLSGVMIDRPFHDATASPCWFCEFKEDCYQGYAAEIKQGTENRASGQAETDATQFLTLRSSRLSLEKEEDLAKKTVEKFMFDNKISNLLVGTSALILSAGKNNNPILKVKETK